MRFTGVMRILLTVLVTLSVAPLWSDEANIVFEIESQSESPRFEVDTVTVGGTTTDSAVRLTYSGRNWFIATNMTDAVITAEGETVFSEAGEGETWWMPETVGTYRLVHRPSGGGERAEAVFTFTGPTVTIRRGEDGTSCEIVSDRPGATIYYTIDNTLPTFKSHQYNMPINLDTNLTYVIRAFAHESGHPRGNIVTSIYECDYALKRTNDVLIVLSGIKSILIPNKWIEEQGNFLSQANWDYKLAAYTLTANGRPLWENYVTGANSIDPKSRFTAQIKVVDGHPVVTWTPDLNENGTQNIRKYTVLGCKAIGDSWENIDNATEEEKGAYHFFKVLVEIP